MPIYLKAMLLAGADRMQKQPKYPDKKYTHG